MVLAVTVPASAYKPEPKQHLNNPSLAFSQPQPAKALAETPQPVAEPTATGKFKPTAPRQSAPSGNIEEIVRAAARKYGANEEQLVRVAKCESGLNPNSVNTHYNENGNPSGLFQHISGYWPARAAKYGFAGASVFDPTANAGVTAQMFRDGLQGLWACK